MAPGVEGRRGEKHRTGEAVGIAAMAGRGAAPASRGRTAGCGVTKSTMLDGVSEAQRTGGVSGRNMMRGVREAKRTGGVVGGVRGAKRTGGVVGGVIAKRTRGAVGGVIGAKRTGSVVGGVIGAKRTGGVAGQKMGCASEAIWVGGEAERGPREMRLSTGGKCSPSARLIAAGLQPQRVVVGPLQSVQWLSGNLRRL